MKRLLRAAFLTCTLPFSAAAQSPLGAVLPTDATVQTTVPDRSVAWSRWQSGKQALAAGDLPAAREHLLATLEFHPAALPVWLDLLLACGDDVDLQHLHADGCVAAAIDAAGRFTLDPAQRRALAPRAGLAAVLEQARKVAATRTAAIAELARYVDRNKPQGAKNAARAVLVHWAATLLATIGADTPKAVTAAAPGVTKVQAAFVTDLDLVLQGLQRVLQQRAQAQPGDTEAIVMARALRAARILVGLQQQTAYPNLPGPPPRDLGSLADAAQTLLAQRAAELAATARVWTIAELEQLTPAEVSAFTDAHAAWHNPAVASSTTGRYRIETCCGHETLLEVARTVERHHERLATHSGADPFAERQGTVRIVPEHGDLETEGAPYWWAGGFQAGDRTVVRFAWSNGPELGRTLTHELTHRFDGVLRPFLGGWYGEGHAQWTANNYARTTDTEFALDVLDVHAVAQACYKGYGDRGSFEQLLAGTLAEYRDNYVAGYALYTFLRCHPLRAPKFGEPLGRFERGSRAAQKDAVGWFTQCFCDGKEGRPATLEAFLVEWNTWLRGCYDWNDDRTAGNEWVGEYRRPERAEQGPMLLDAPTWSWSRTRAEPWFGQDHAAAATLLLHEVGDAQATVAAGVWSLCADGWRADTAAALGAALRSTGPTEAAEAFAVLAASRVPLLPAPPCTRLPEQAKATRVLLTTLAQRVETLRATAPLAAAASAAEHDRIARWLGVPGLGDASTRPRAAAHHLAGLGLAETSLTDFDEGRVPALWYATADGDLHVGREQPRDATGTLDRAAHRRKAFVHGTEWLLPGEYVVRGRVHFTTSYVDGAIVFGHTRRDRDLRLTFTAGDERYAIGKSERDTSGGVLGLALSGLWERDGKLPGTAFRSLELPANQTWFDFVLHVRGARVDVAINGEPAITYAMHDGTTIEGQVGFAMATGAVRVQAPMVQRLDGPLTGLDLGRACTRSLDDLLLLPVRGVQPGPSGTFVLWLPPPVEGAQVPAARLPRVVERFADLLQTAHLYPQDWQVAVPAATPADEHAAVTQVLHALRPDPVPVLEHAVALPFDGSFPWLLFVDAGGLLRAAAVVTDPAIRMEMTRWARMLRPR